MDGWKEVMDLQATQCNKGRIGKTEKQEFTRDGEGDERVMRYGNE